MKTNKKNTEKMNTKLIDELLKYTTDGFALLHEASIVAFYLDLKKVVERILEDRRMSAENDLIELEEMIKMI